MSVYDCPLSCSTRPSDSGGGRPESAASQSDRATAHQQEVGGVTHTPPLHCRLYSTTTSLRAVLHHHLTAGCTPPPPHCRLYSRYKKKMDDYECRFVSLQRHSPATAEVTQLRDTLTGLAERSESM